jgi:cysteine synthase A
MARDDRLLPSVIDAIGSTPLVELHRLRRALGLRGRLLAKLECLNPGFSKKDRIAREMILEARREGRLAPGQPVIELTSGNTGTGLAIVCGALGHPFIAVMSRGNTAERARMMAALGAEVVIVEQAPGSPPHQVSGADLALVAARTEQLALERGAFRADQFTHRGNVLAHERHTGPEIWRQSGGAVTCFVDFAGTAGTFTGVMRALRAENPRVSGYLVEPATAAVLAGRPVTNASHRIQGGGYAMAHLPLLEPGLVTGHLAVADAEALSAARLLAHTEGIFGGCSAGANLAGAIAVLRGPEPEATVAFLVCDSGLKYLSTDLYPAGP